MKLYSQVAFFFLLFPLATLYLLAVTLPVFFKEQATVVYSAYVNPICTKSCMNFSSSDWLFSDTLIDSFARNVVVQAGCFYGTYVWPTYRDWPEVLAKQNIFPNFKITERTDGVGPIGSVTTGYKLSTCPLDATFLANETVEVQEWIRMKQFPSNCSTEKLLFSPKFYESGMGSSLHMLLYPFSEALSKGYVFIPPSGSWIWGRCESHDLNCYFESVTNCSSLPGTEMFDSRARLGTHNLRLPSRWAHKDWNWWRAQLMAFLFRPKITFLHEKILPAAISQFPSGIQRPYASIFFRAGDKAQEVQPYSAEAYLNLLLPFTKQLSIKSVYLNSDTQSVLDEAREVFVRAGFEVYSINMKRSFTYSHLKHFSDTAFDELTTMSLVDIFLQLAGDVFVGTSTSNWCRLIDELRLVRGKLAAPWIDPGGHPLIEF